MNSKYDRTDYSKLVHGKVRLGELRQLDVVAEVYDLALIDPSHVDEIVQRTLSEFGSLFALVRNITYSNGSFRGVAQFCKSARASTILSTRRFFDVQVSSFPIVFIRYTALWCLTTLQGVRISLKCPEDLLGVDELVGGMGSMVLSGSSARHRSSQDLNPFTASAPEGNPWAPIAYQFAGGPIANAYGPFYGPPTPAMTAMTHSRTPSYGPGPHMGSFANLSQRRYPRTGRGPSRGMNNTVDIYELVAGRDVRTTVSESRPLTTSRSNIRQIMLRNIPNKVDQPLLKRIVDSSSFGKYDFMYLRIDFANDCK